MYRFPHGLEELEGIANRTDFDLGSHSKDQAGLTIDAQVLANPDSERPARHSRPRFGRVAGAVRHRAFGGRRPGWCSPC